MPPILPPAGYDGDMCEYDIIMEGRVAYEVADAGIDIIDTL